MIECSGVQPFVDILGTGCSYIPTLFTIIFSISLPIATILFLWKDSRRTA